MARAPKTGTAELRSAPTRYDYEFITIIGSTRMKMDIETDCVSDAEGRLMADSLTSPLADVEVWRGDKLVFRASRLRHLH